MLPLFLEPYPRIGAQQTSHQYSRMDLGLYSVYSVYRILGGTIQDSKL